MTHTLASGQSEVGSVVFDVLIIGAGLSGIGAACHLRRACPDKTFALLERRAAMGGTWDLFRYPGVRSDSDVATFGYAFRPWSGPEVLAAGAQIKQYVIDTAREYDVERHIRFGRKVVRADWSSEEGLWTIVVAREDDGRVERYRARFVLGCTGYYNYDAGFSPSFPDETEFRGRIVHPQHWPSDLDCTGKRVVVLGSGATAITLVPALAERGAEVTMLQRSPSYVLSLPSVDPAADLMRRLPRKVAYHLTRARNIAVGRAIFVAARTKPKAMRRMLLGQVEKALGGKVSLHHFTPRYEPWDERLCIVPDGDLFKVLRDGKASIVTDEIESFTKTGLRLKSGQVLEADVVVKATGLDIQMFGGVEVRVDGEPFHVQNKLVYRGVLMQDLPNAAMVFGYTNLSWTLKVDIACAYVCRLLQHMDKQGYATVVARAHDGLASDETIFGAISAGYVRRAKDRLPRQGKRAPWRVWNDYLRDRWMLRASPMTCPSLEFRVAPRAFASTSDRGLRDAAGAGDVGQAAPKSSRVPRRTEAR